MNAGAARGRHPGRPHGPGRRHGGGGEALAVRGLLHDLSHEATTLSLLVESVRTDPGLPASTGARMELLSHAASRLLDIIFRGLSGEHGRDAGDIVDVRVLAGQAAELAAVTHGTSVTVRPGPDAHLRVSSVLLWRALSNVVGNAARAAGPAGHVDLVIGRVPDIVIDVIDDGPGFGQDPPGITSLGLGVATSLLASCGGGLEISSAEAAGARVRIVLPAQLDASGNNGSASHDGS